MSLDPVEDVPMYGDEEEESEEKKEKSKKKAKKPRARKLSIKRRDD